MTIRLATIDDLPEVMQIVKEVVREMEEEGNLQWSDIYPDRQRFLTDIQNNALYIPDITGKVAGFVAIDQNQAEEYAQVPWSEPGDAVVIHRLAVAQDSRNLGIASHFEAFACQLALQHRANQVRVDTYLTNTGMQTFLQKKGYRKVGEMRLVQRPLPFVCFEKLLDR